MYWQPEVSCPRLLATSKKIHTLTLLGTSQEGLANKQGQTFEINQMIIIHFSPLLTQCLLLYCCAKYAKIFELLVICFETRLMWVHCSGLPPG